MSTNTNIFDVTKRFVDLTGLDYFWGKAKNYIDVADGKLASDLDALAAAVDALKGTGTGSVADQIAALGTTLRGEMATEQAARIAAEEKIAKDAADANDALEAALKKYADGAVSAEAALRVEEDSKLSSAISTLRGEYEVTKGRIDTFLDSKEVAGTVDTLHEIQEWMNGEGVNATELTEAIAAEAKLRGDADTALGNRIDALSGTVSDMDAAYKAADEALQGSIDTLSGTVASNKAAIEKTVSDMDAAYKAADEALQGSIDTLSGTVSDMDAAYKAADNGLAADIAALEAKLYGTTGENAVVGDLDKMKSDLQTYADQAEADAVTAANTYTDELFNSVKFVSEADINGLTAGWDYPVAE